MADETLDENNISLINHDGSYVVGRSAISSDNPFVSFEQSTISIQPSSFTVGNMRLSIHGVLVGISIIDGTPTVTIENNGEVDEINVKVIGVTSALGDPITNLTYYK